MTGTMTRSTPPTKSTGVRAGRYRRYGRRLATVGLAAALVTTAGGVLATRSPSPRPPATQTTVSNPDRLVAAIADAQRRLRALPGDYPTWAALGSAYTEQARITADPSYYPKAEGALRRSLRLRPTDNPAALTGLGALANARHDFAGARVWAQRALRTDPYSASAYGVLTDALTQLGQADAATTAAQHMLDLRPGLAAFTRASYDLEQRGRLADAESLMRGALRAATDPADLAFCRYQLGQLAWQDGRLADADREYRAGLAADPSYLPLRAGRAAVAAATGSVSAALTDYASLVAGYPSPTYLLQYADLLRAAGRTSAAASQLDLADAAVRLFAANGGADDLTAAEVALARGRGAEAVTLARREWKRRQHADVADVLAWALHASGKDREALGYARRATAHGAPYARYAYHLGVIEAALGDTASARRDLTRALRTNAHFSPVDSPLAAAVLARLGTQ